MESPETRPRKRVGGALLITIGVIALITAGLCATTYFMVRSSALQFARNGRPAKSEIEAVQQAGNPPVLYVSYKYKDKEGKITYHGKDAYPFADGKDLKVGQPLDILYLAHTTNVSRTARRQALMVQKMASPPWAMVGGLGAMGCFLISFGIRKKRLSPTPQNTATDEAA